MPDQALQPMLAERDDEPVTRLRGRLLAGSVALVVLVLVTLGILAYRAPYFPVDLAITRLVQSTELGWIGNVVHPLNVLGFPPLVGFVYGTTILAIFFAGARWEAVTSTFATLGAAGLNDLVKIVVARPRPPVDLVHVPHHLSDYAFPAGHVLNITAFFGFLCYLTWARLAPSWQRTALMTFLVTMIALMGIARIYAGDHWPSDVLGAYCLGLLWLATTVALYRWGRRRSRKHRLESVSSSPQVR